MKKKFFFLVLLSHSLCSQAQVSIAYFPFQSLLCLGSDSEKLVWGDFKMETNSFMTNLNMELSPKINFKRSASLNYYCGIGLSFNPVYVFADLSPINGVFIDVGARIKPLSQYRNFQIVFEISPYINKELSGGNFRTRLGVAWNFRRTDVN